MLNPVFRRELRTALRTWKTLTILCVYILLLTGSAALFLSSTYSNMQWNGYSPKSAASLYSNLANFQLGLIIIIVPILVCGTISGERERQTLDLMLVTKMSPFTIIIGKLFSALTVVLLMIVAALPVFGIATYYGSVSVLNLLATCGYSLAVAFAVGCLSIFLSASIKKTVPALAITFLLAAILCYGTTIGTQLLQQFVRVYYGDQPLKPIIGYSILAFNPFSGFSSVLDLQMGTSGINDMIYQYYYYNPYSGAMAQAPEKIALPLWAANLGVNAIFSAVFLFLGSLALNPIKKSRKFK